MDDARAVEPVGGPLDVTVAVPGSKSFTNRALVCAALAEGMSTLRGVLFADDTEAMLGCLRDLGIAVDADRAAGTVVVRGCAGTVPPGPAELDARMSGTTGRFLAPIAALGSGRYRLTGSAQLRGRPMEPAVDALRSLGVTVEEDGEPGHLPVTIEATGGLDGGRIELPGHASSQFLSGLLLAAPAMRSGLRVDLTSELVSRPYVEMTEACMAAFGVTVRHEDSAFVVAPSPYRGTGYAIEPDASAASYFFAAAAICGGRVRVEGLGGDTVQGDLRFVEILREMGAEVEVTDGWTEVRGTGTLRGVTVDLADLSDTAPTLAVVAACAEGETRVTGIGFIRKKETDRIAAVVTELRRCAVDAEEHNDGFVVRPSPAGPHGARIETYDDHRMAMSFAVLGLRVPDMAIVDADCVAKTFPSFFEVLGSLRVGSAPSVPEG